LSLKEILSFIKRVCTLFLVPPAESKISDSPISPTLVRPVANQDVPFLFRTGYNSLNDVDACLRQAPVLTKPVSTLI
jgi:hypothetical protein